MISYFENVEAVEVSGDLLAWIVVVI